MMAENKFKNIYMTQRETQEETLSPTFGQTMSAAFGLENDMVNLYDYVSRPKIQPDPTFDYRKPFAEGAYPQEWMPRLAGTTSQLDFDLTVKRMQEEDKKRAVLGASGLTGTVAAMGAGVLSPTTFLPFVGQGRRGMAFAEILGLAAAGATAQEAVLLLNQETRTEAEAFESVALQTLFAGMLGAAWARFTPDGQARMARDFPDAQRKVLVAEGPVDLGYAKTRPVRVEAPPIEESARLLRSPDLQGRDVGASPKARVEVDVRDGFVRVYQIGSAGVEGTPLRYTLDREVAAQQSDHLYHIDLPLDDPRMAQVAARADGQTPELQLTLSEAERGQLREVYKGPDPNDPVVRERLDAAAEGDEVDMAIVDNTKAIPDSSVRDADPVGAQVAGRARNTQGPKAAPSKWRQAALDALGKTSPWYRMAKSRQHPSLRDAAFRLADTGVHQEGLAHAEPSAVGGSIYDRFGLFDRYLAEYIQTFESSYYKYVYGATSPDPNVISNTVAQLKFATGMLPPGKMNPHEFHEAIYDSLSQGEILLPEVKPAVEGLRKFFSKYNEAHKDYLKELQETNPEVAPLYKELMDDEFGVGVRDYAHQIYSSELINSKSDEFLHDFSTHYQKELEGGFSRDYKRFLKRKHDLEFEKNFGALTPEQRGEYLAEVVAEIEELDELPELVARSTQRAELRQEARDSGWDAKQLREELKALDEGLSPMAKELLDEQNSLKARARVMRKLGGAVPERITRLEAAIAKEEEKLESMFRHVMPAIERADVSIARVQKEGDKVLAKAEGDVAKALKGLQERQARYLKLLQSRRTNTKSRARVMEQVEAKKAVYDDALFRLVTTKGKGVALDDRLREYHYARELAVKDAAELAAKRGAKKAEAEAELTEAKETLLTPEEQAAYLAKLDSRLLDNELSFNEKWRNRGERSGDPSLGNPDFAQESLDMATYWMQKLTKADIEPAYFIAKQDARGPQLMRMQNIPYAIKKKYLNRNTEVVARAYDRTMAPDLEIWRAFDGHVNGSNVLAEMSQEASDLQAAMFKATHVKLPKGWVDKSKGIVEKIQKRLYDTGSTDELYIDPKNFSTEAKEGYVELTPELRTQITNAINAELSQQTRNFNIAIQRLRNTRLVPKDANDMLYRTGRFIKDMNVPLMMGSVLPASIPDLARPIYAHGIGKVARQAWGSYITNLKSASGKPYKVASKEVNRQLGLTLETVLSGRANSVFDMSEPYAGNKTVLEKGAKFLAHKTGIIALFSYWTQANKAVAGAVTQATILTYIPRVAEVLKRNGAFEGESQAMLEYLRQRGLRDLDILRIAGQIERPGMMEEFSNGAKLPNLDLWEDMAAYRAYGAAVRNEVNKLIITPGLEQPNIVDENIATSMIFQFKSFMFASTSRIAMSNLQGSDPYLVQGTLATLAMGALSYYTWAVASGDPALERANELDIQDWIYESVDRSGILGALSFPQKVGEQIPYLAQFAVFGGEEKAYRRPVGLLGTVFGPSAGQFEKMTEFLKNVGAEEPGPQRRNLKLLRQLMIPYQNHFLLRRGFDAVGDSINSALGIAE